MAVGHCGFGLGATPNAMANMEAFTAKNFPSPQAFFVLPIVGSLFIDFINSGVITAFLNFLYSYTNKYLKSE
jgi:glutamate:Na+ symporter, ESS family